MPQQQTWETEYNRPQLLKLSDRPRNDLKDYLKFLRKSEKVVVKDLNILDLGSGNGKNSIYLAELGNQVAGLDISPTAVAMSQAAAKAKNIKIDFQVGNIGQAYNLPTAGYDLVIDVMSSNSLHESERDIYLSEVARVLKSGGYFFVRALCKDGDKHAKNLLTTSPGTEYDTYIIPDMHLVERVFSKEDFIKTYSQYFQIQKLLQKTNYVKFKGQSYKRNYWLVYMKKV